MCIVYASSTVLGNDNTYLLIYTYRDIQIKNNSTQVQSMRNSFHYYYRTHDAHRRNEIKKKMHLVNLFKLTMG